ncbi:MAG TPA: hypothetical protein VGE00_09530 [Gammaproteobacteria bacterium]
MYRQLALMGLSLTVAAPLWASPLEIGGGLEQFVWEEFDDGGTKLIKESGPRAFVSLEKENEVSERWTYGFRGRFYSGTVDCDGQLKAGGSCTSNDTDYDGLAMTADFTGRFLGADGEYSDLGLRLAVGGETWQRSLSGASSYSEEYVVFFGKLGLAYTPEQGLFGEVGAKYPFSVDEDVDLYDDLSLSPQGAMSLYAQVGYNLNQRWVIKGYYDSYRFKASDTEPLINGGTLVGDVKQAESNMDTLGVMLGFYF